MKNLILLILLSTLSLIATCEVTGYAFLQNQTNHSGIKVKFTPYSPTAVLDSTYTNSDGSYNVSLEVGVYYINFIKQGYQTFLYNYGDPTVLTANSTLSDVTLLQGNIVYLSGNINGTLTADNIYIIEADVNIANNDELNIEPGTVIKFEIDCNMNVYGLLQAIGTDEDKILFTSTQNKPGSLDWEDLYFHNSANDNSILRHCIIEYGSQVYLDGANISIENCEIRHMFDGIVCENSNVLIKDNFIHHYRYRGVFIQGTSIVTIQHNLIFLVPIEPGDYHRGIWVSGTGNVLIESNRIYNPSGNSNDVTMGIWNDGGNTSISNNIIRNCLHGIYSITSNPTNIINNLVINNFEYGLFAGECSTLTLVQSNIFMGNNVGIHTYNENEFLEISYNNVWNNTIDYDSEIPGIGQNITTNNNGDPCDPYYNISLDPLFVDSTNFDFHLEAGSPVIDAGDNSNVISQFDLDGNPRILDGNNNGNAVVDMGVYEAPDLWTPTSFNSLISMITIFPNPSSMNFYIQMKDIVKPINVTLISSQGITLDKLRSIPNDNNSPYKIEMAQYPNGIYFLKFQNKDFIAVRRIIKK